MVETVRQTVTVQPGGVIRLQSDQLLAGTTADVIVLTGPEQRPNQKGKLPGSTWESFIGCGVSTGRTVEEIDAYIRELRDEWDR